MGIDVWGFFQTVEGMFFGLGWFICWVAAIVVAAKKGYNVLWPILASCCVTPVLVLIILMVLPPKK